MTRTKKITPGLTHVAEDSEKTGCETGSDELTEDVPTEDDLTEDAPAEDVPAEDVPAEDDLTEDVPAEDAPVEDVPEEDVLTEDDEEMEFEEDSEGSTLQFLLTGIPQKVSPSYSSGTQTYSNLGQDKKLEE